MTLRFRGLAGPLLTTLLVLFALPSRAETVAPSPNAPILTLEEAIGRAVAASPRLDASRSTVAAAAGTERQAHLFPNPEVSLGAENIAGTGPYGGIANAELTYGISQFIELGGKREARQAAAAAERRAAETDLDAAKLDLIRDVTMAYAAVVAAEQNLRLARDLEATAQKVLEDVSRRVAAAKDPLFQKSRAEVALTTATIARQRAEEALRGGRERLARYWNATTVAEGLASDTLYAADAPAALPIYEARLTKTPDIVRFERLREARQADLALAEAANVPDLRANVGVRQFPGSNDTAVVAGISLPIPVWNQNQGEIARASAEVRRMASELRAAQLERSQQLVDAWTEWKSAWIEIQKLRAEALPQAERAFNLALAGFRQGGFRYLDVLDAQRAFFETRGALLAALVRLQEARARVERLTGHALQLADANGAP
jgi:cobalt-zinc-cadmium efflux system outer membrane protein